MAADPVRAAFLVVGVAIGATAGGAAHSAGSVVPSQEEWAAQKEQVELPNGQTIAYVDLGDPGAPPVLLIHGYTDNSRSWSLMAPYVADQFRLVAVDLRGHGKSEAPDCCYGLPDMADDMRLLLDALDIDRASVVGHSLGSMVAQVFAQRYPERLDRLVLVSSAASASGLSGPGSWLWDSIHQLREPIDPNSQFMLDWYANPNPVDEDFLTRERGESAAVRLQVWKGVLYELATSEYGRLSSQIKPPTLILWGGKDGFFDAAAQEALRQAMPNAKFLAFDTLGHNLMWEQPERIAGEIASFLK